MREGFSTRIFCYDLNTVSLFPLPPHDCLLCRFCYRLPSLQLRQPYTTIVLRKPHYRPLCKFRYRLSSLQRTQLWAFRGLEMTIKPRFYLHIDQQRE